MNPNLDLLQPYPFEKLRQLKAGAQPPAELEHIALSIGEPKHPAPQFALDALSNQLATIANYPVTLGLPELREACADWSTRRFNLKPGTLSSETQVLPVNGTREALFAFVQVAVDSSQPSPSVLMPNPFYQIYEGAAILAGAKPVFLNCTEENGFLCDFDRVPAATWKACQLLFICNPGNPTGAVMSLEQQIKLIELADEHDFIIASDECYSELYFDEHTPPPGLLQACAAMGRDDYKRCVIFHSLSKRSNLPGLRSGFVAGDQAIIEKFYQYRTYHGCAMPLFAQAASIAAWRDETHVVENRELYRQKFDRVLAILGDSLPVIRPDASFYLWPQTPVSDTEFARDLFAEQHVTVLPGSYLARSTADGNPGSQRIRMALVASLDECEQAAQRLRAFVEARY
ncbi:succinyldiaminopimelate transaminase [Teredinibacter turnerae T7901]|uniref:Succinyldiaminopimelate transaminase n=1 Tax=Teredinibacter turnerae (strain ATCC 39867 / T7901) TaxID=377629 RepID=C5BQF3_TERTT|nr:succinyldiaminopimelate transaminase [Teredinibacter turnerae]ACR12784.1 succinyldiaminopimelate transaminase [Teredinibacter turnerae T7901]